jgi:hypothetical protein
MQVSQQRMETDEGVGFKDGQLTGSGSNTLVVRVFCFLYTWSLPSWSVRRPVKASSSRRWFCVEFSLRPTWSELKALTSLEVRCYLRRQWKEKQSPRHCRYRTRIQKINPLCYLDIAVHMTPRRHLRTEMVSSVEWMSKVKSKALMCGGV